MKTKRKANKNMAKGLHNLKSIATKSRKRVGRGNSSGHGSYSGRGVKGQKARSGGKGGLKLKGFKKILLNLPKFKGMKSKQLAVQIVKISSLEKKFNDQAIVSPATLLAVKLIKKEKHPVKFLIDQKDLKITKRFEFSGCRFSKSAREFLEKNGCKILEVEDVHVEKN